MHGMSLDHVDVLIVGAGLSGVGAACHLKAECPDKTFALLEARESMGGTWDLFRYPGIRSDSDMQTLGYRFKPWTDEKAIADGPAILDYVQETADEYDVRSHIRFHHRVVGAEFSSADARWTVRATHDGTDLEFTCGLLFACSGYYRYDQPFDPEFPGRDDFKGEIVHPQFWPDELDYAGKRVVVIGSGATAVTLVPAMTDEAAHVTMLQRTPTYIVSVPAKDPIINTMRKVLGEERAYSLGRRKNVAIQGWIYRTSHKRPQLIKRLIRKFQEKQLPDGYDIDTHFTPPYNPWTQRLCVVPDGDLFRAIRHEKATIVTDRVERFTETGIQLESGAELEADIIVTATGLNLQIFGGAGLVVDGQPVVLPETYAYKGLMLSGVPNFAYAIGYTNASWTLKVDLTCEFVCRLLAHMDAHDYDTFVPRADDTTLTAMPLLDFQAGYVLRSIDQFPKQGSRAPWQQPMNYNADVKVLRQGPVEDPELEFSRSAARVPAVT
jgi:cation diffusion facilitator CzcD-associated flavoprotein CzcO